ncbi:alpha/beta fold hydrolase [Pseudobacteriovorax antillogorgiicola]|uniref:Pimeloyl-ACP methyl ester carboxylesterase n=1 Tax=Pseudobacteriovorax antillogorgiicola TaxID=1513793 RepID=A0A1Y6CQE1_9BACT|nr:alpha/beta hydrolase [Pseudobacteriovorax antillogorgiicola]TCS43490.1 pimeloyl-ACP methyl ester carboxylesterase [Pseudobacteriovorax antillogorgiicola]SMF81209.1 Pimeloyl-ACP methyl ester carboxylesterase [Pseudobacteriovorax antillogorgiicola]
MLAKLDQVQNSIKTVKDRVNKTGDQVLDSVYGMSKRINVMTFQPLPKSANRLYDAIPNKPRDTAEKALERWFEQIPKSKKIKWGEDIFSRYISLRRAVIGGEERIYDSPEGPICYWETKRKPGKETIVFFHGFADTKDNLFDLAQHMVPDYHFFAPDIPGFGKSFKNPQLNYELTSMADWLKGLMDDQGIEQFHLIGHSMGGGLAIDFALKYPEMVKSLCLICCAGVITPDAPSIYDEILDGEVLFQIETMDEFEDFLGRAFYNLPFVPPFVKQYYFNQFLENYDWYGLLVEQTFENMESRDDPRFQPKFFNDQLPSLQIPTHIIWGEKDAIFPADYGKEAHRLIPGSTLNILSDIGHSPQYESPKQVAKLIRGFLQHQIKQDDCKLHIKES